jgi:cell division protein FtsL
MTGRRRLGLFLLVAGMLVLAASGVVWRKHAPAIAKMRSDSAVFEDSLERVHAELIHQSLLLKGLTASEATLPDTVRRYGAGKMIELSNGYNKVIRKLENREDDVKLQIRWLTRDTEKEIRNARAQALPVAGAGVVLVLIGIVLSAVPARRVGA